MMSATVKKKKEESEKKKLEQASSSLDVLTEGLKRSILPQIRKLDGTIANARWSKKKSRMQPIGVLSKWRE